MHEICGLLRDRDFVVNGRGECQALGVVHSSFQWTGVQVTVVELHHWHHSPPKRRTAAVSGMCHLWNKMPRASFHSCRSRTIESNLGALVRRQTPFSHSTIRTPTIRNIIDDIQQAERRGSELKINQTQNGELFRP
ncbi:hypothetical protein T08_7575 [Trichinella sp. T8]|nr:hypothetical protein T08_7575 [Trichinella sp. T8]